MRFSRMMLDILRSTGRAIVPAVTAMERGECGDKPRREQNCSRKERVTWDQWGEWGEKESE